MKIARACLLLCAALLVATGAGLLLFRFAAVEITAHRTAISETGGIDSLEKIRLGGVDQWIQIRGHDRGKPILLFLHGGPGFPEMPFSLVNADLEKTFVVVQWDQRNAGKSYAPDAIPADSMKIAQFVSDTHELTQLLLQRFGKKKCYLVGFSWGSLVGALTVAKYPESYLAYISIGQLASLPQTQVARYDFALEYARQQQDATAASELARIGAPPYKNFQAANLLETWVHRFEDRQHRSITPGRFVWLAFCSPAYTWADLANILRGTRYTIDHLWRELSDQANLFQQAPQIDVPVYFLVGRYDEVVTAKVAVRYFDALDAPQGKHLIWFEKSGHWIQFDEPAKYRSVLEKLAR